MFDGSYQKQLIMTITRSFFIALLLLSGSLFAQAQEAAKTITLEDIWETGTFNTRGIRGFVSMNDGIHYTLHRGDSINQYRFDNGNFVQTIISPDELIPVGDGQAIKFQSYSFSSDERKIILATETESIYRYSTRSNYYVYDRETSTLVPLSTNGKQQLADFSPNGSKVAFVRDNNIFIVDLESMAENQITHDGLDRHIINGTTDWVYEEEFAFTKGFHWSPDSKRIAFIRFDESHVKEFWMVNYGSLYPDHYKFKYPKAGEENATVSIHIYNVSEKTTLTVDIGAETDIYLPRMQWTKHPEKLVIQRLNRHQNRLQLLLADALSGSTTAIYEEHNKYYIDITNDLTFTNDGKSFIVTSEKDGFNHIYHYEMSGKLIRQITSGPWDVTAFYGLDPSGQQVYFQAARQSPHNREIYVININGKGLKGLSEAPGTNTANFSTNFNYFINTTQSVAAPPIVSVNDRNGKTMRVLEDNSKLIETVSEYGFAPVEFFSFNTSENISLNAWMIKPLDFSPDKKYPVLMYVYGGPGSQTVTNSWGRATTSWFQMLTQQGYIIVSVDNRGTGARGEEFKKMTYRQLGYYETIDQIEGARHLSSLPYIDSERIGIFGWSYGGYMALLCLTKGSEFFKAAIAVAPVTSWRYYNTAYTERFMRTPQENPSGYDDNSPIHFTDQMTGSLLLVHGTGDDNVHVENSIEMIDALVSSNKQFDVMLYPNRDHGIYGGNTRLHLFRMMTDFLEKKL
jgi:dipeptidyl-peptidase 4